MSKSVFQIDDPKIEEAVLTKVKEEGLKRKRAAKEARFREKHPEVAKLLGITEEPKTEPAKSEAPKPLAPIIEEPVATPKIETPKEVPVPAPAPVSKPAPAEPPKEVSKPASAPVPTPAPPRIVRTGLKGRWF
jgi:hypothetical protein